MASRRVHVGETAVDLIPDGHLDIGRDHFVHNRGAEAAAAAISKMDDRSLRVEVNCFLMRGPRGVELVDAGSGPSRGADLGHARAVLAALGIAPEAIHRVFLTHMHFDHALGLLDGDRAFFPGAEIVVPADDLAFYTDPAARARTREEWRSVFDDAARIAAAYAGRLRRAAFGPVAPGVDLFPIPGHSRGQGAYRLAGGGAPLVLLGDLLHLAAEQAADPDLSLIYDDDPVAAARTRRSILADAASEGWIVGGGHLDGFCRVTVDGAGFGIVPLA